MSAADDNSPHPANTRLKSPPYPVAGYHKSHLLYIPHLYHRQPTVVSNINYRMSSPAPQSSPPGERKLGVPSPLGEKVRMRG